MTFGERLKEARQRKGLTQEELAKQIGVAKSTLTGYEKGNREPDFFKIKKLTEILDVNADYLLGINLSNENEAIFEDTAEPFFVNENEKRLIISYRNHSDLQPAVNKLLEIHNFSEN